MPRTRRHPEFDPTLDYIYPEHLREYLDDLPQTPGVYIFHGLSDSLPLYIGKSINIRTRVMSHFRTLDEARMLRQTQRITFIQTVGEIGALLLEAQLIKEQQPLFNQKLRRTRQMCSIRLQDDKPEIVYSKDIDFAHTPNLYGLFASRHSALEALKDLADEAKLCLGLLGIEKASANRPCFRHMLKRCAGACCGVETVTEHHNRLTQQLENQRIECWPYAGPIGLIEKNDTHTDIHVVHNWLYLGSAVTIEQARELSTIAAAFDSDGYKILCKPILTSSLPIVEL
jgi:excinuclease Cho